MASRRTRHFRKLLRPLQTRQAQECGAEAKSFCSTSLRGSLVHRGEHAEDLLEVAVFLTPTKRFHSLDQDLS